MRAACRAMHKSALAIAAHPDDIEFLMAGTLLLLRQQGWEVHCFNVSSGSLGSMEWKPKKTRRVRAQEARASAKLMGAHWHAPVADDLEITYSTDLLRSELALASLPRYQTTRSTDVATESVRTSLVSVRSHIPWLPLRL